MSPSHDRGSALVILGAGLAGLAAAWQASRARIPSVLFEELSEPGGLARTFTHEGHRFDSGAHRVHLRDPALERDLRVLGIPLVPVEAPNRVHLTHRQMAFPPGPLDCLRGLGPRDALGLAGSWLRGMTGEEQPAGSFAELALRRFGSRLCGEVLFPYSQKLWGVAPEALHPRVATRRLSGWSVGQLARHLLHVAARAEHLDGAFLYPRDGIGGIATAIVQRLSPSSLRMGMGVRRLEVSGGRVVRVHFGAGPPHPVGPGVDVLSTIPLPALGAALGDALPRVSPGWRQALRFRQLRLVFMRLARASVSHHGTQYFPADGVCFTRVSEPRNRSRRMAAAGETGLLVEVPCFKGDALDSLSDAALEGRVLSELQRVGMLRRARVLSCTQRRLADAYPVHTLAAEGAAASLRRAVGQVRNLHILGRCGGFRYGHIHDQFRQARELVAASDARRGQPLRAT